MMFWLLKDDLRLYLKNKYRADEITDNEVEAIIFKLVSSSHEPLYEANKALFTEMVEGFFFRREDKTKQDLFVRLIDFDDVVNNIFKIVNQFEVKGVQETRIPDSVVFINGLPLVVLEFKSAIKENTTIYNAYQQVTVRYTRDIPDLFKYNAFVIISDGVNNKYGSLFADYDYFYSWNKIGDEETLAEGINSLYVKYQRPIGNDVFRARWENDGECGLSVWYDAFECREGTKSLGIIRRANLRPIPSLPNERSERAGSYWSGAYSRMTTFYASLIFRRSWKRART